MPMEYMCCQGFIHYISAKLMNPLVITLSLISFLLLLILHLKPTKSKKPNLPPCPPKLPILGNLHQLGAHPHRSLATLARKHGPVMHVQLGRCVPALIISSASAAEKIMKTHDLIFLSRPQSSVANRLLYNCKDVAFAPYGEYWRQMRKICVVHLLSSKRVQSFRLVREEEVANMVVELRNLSSSSGGGLVNLSEVLDSLTNNVVCRVAFGRKFDGGAKNHFHAMLTEFLVLLGTFDVGDFIPSLAWVSGLNGFDARVKKCFEVFDAFFERVLNEHIQCRRDGGGDNEGENILDVLLALQNDDSFVGVTLSRDSIKALILDMFADGTDTVHTVIDWAMAELIKHPNMMMKARDEVNRTIGTKSMIKEDDTEKTSYLKMIIKEVLRLHPPLPLLVPRESTEEIELFGYTLPTKMRVFVNAWAIGRDAESWKDPEEFCPERFANTAVDFEGKDFELIPFGAGRRGCPGIHFATPTINLAIASLLHHFDWELPEGRRGEELDMEEGTGLTVHRKSRLLVIAKSRLA